MKDCFTLFDTNNDGMIDADELQAGFEGFGQKRRRSSILRMIDLADKDDNKMVDFEEFVMLMKEAEMDGSIERAMAEKNKPQDIVDPEQAERDLRRRLERPNLTRDDINASIYGNLSGVKVNETPELITSKTKMFDDEIAQMKPTKKKAFLMAVEKIPDRINDKHKLMFLRAELFNSKKAAIRCCRHWDFMLDIFGPEKAFLPLTQKGALRDDAETLKLALYSDTGEKDSHGQHVLFVNFRSVNASKLDCKAVCRCAVYTIWNRVERDEVTQQNGMVAQMTIPQSTRTWNPRITRQMSLYVRYGAPVRLACVHALYPGRFFKVIFRVGRILAGELSSRIKVFAGTPQEVMEQMKDYGLTEDRLVEEVGGKVVLDREKYLRDMAAMEEKEE